MAYLVIATAITFPFVVDPAGTLTAPLFSDVTGSISKFQTLIREGQTPFVPVHLDTIGWPDGVTVTPGVDRVAWLNTLYLWTTTRLFGGVPAHSLLYILGMIGTAIVTCLFVGRVTGSISAGFLAGLACGFWPQMYFVGWAAPTYTWMWMLVLPIWGFYRLGIAPSFRTGGLAGMSPLLAMFWTPYFTLHALVVAFACGATVVARAFVIGDLSLSRAKHFIPAAVIPLVALAAYVLIGALSHFGGVPARSVEDAYQESAHPLMFVLPGWHSIWGDTPYQLLVRRVPRAQYANLYLGWSVIALAAVALVVSGRLLFTDRRRALQAPVVLLTLTAAAVVLFCFVFSLPPRLTFLGRSIPMPDDVVIHVQPAFRAGQRFVMPLMAGMAVLAGLGLRFIVGALPTRLAPVAAAVVALVVFVDLFARPPEAVNEVPQSSALSALRAEPSGAVFQYVPFDNSGQMPAVRSCLLQPQYDKPLVDACDVGSPSQDYLKWSSRPDCLSLLQMQAAGVRYVIIDDSLTNLIECMRSELSGHSRRIADDGKLSVYALS